MRVMMLGVDETRKGGMWTVVENYLRNTRFREEINLCYIPTVTAGSVLRRVMYFAGAYLRIRRELRSKQYDIVHMHLSEKGSLYRKDMVQRLAKKAGCKTILHMHGADFEDWYRRRSARAQKHIRGVLSGADRVLILGRYWEAFIGSLLEEKDRMRILYNAVPVPEENRYSPGAGNILFLGAMIRRKGIVDLLRAVASIQNRLPADCRLILCGDDPEGIVDAEIQRLNLQGRVERKGWVNAEQRDEVMRESAVNVLPSYHEGLPMTLLEAMAYGVPSISTTVAAIPEAIANGKNGILVEAGDVTGLAQAILALLEDPALRMRLSGEGRGRARSDFSVESHCAKLISFYAELLSLSDCGPS